MIDAGTAASGWRVVVPAAERLARRAALAALVEVDAPPGEAVNILLTDDRTVQRINYQHRGKNKPTNVLSFPDPGLAGGGDLVLALETVLREARAAGKRPAAHFAHLVAHGTLHLAGHDHLLAGEARRMEQAESRIMRRLRLPNPWRHA